MTERCLHEFNIAAAEADDFSRPTYQAEAIADQGDQHLTMPGVKSDEEQERDGIKDSSVHTEDDLSSDDEVFSCDGCGCMMSGSPGTKWYRCTECVDLDICESCHKKDFHIEHRSQISAFTCPQNMDDAWCDACGKMFKVSDKKEILHQCQICEDYVLCSTCRSHSFHKRHKESMLCVDVPTFLESC